MSMWIIAIAILTATSACLAIALIITITNNRKPTPAAPVSMPAPLPPSIPPREEFDRLLERAEHQQKKLSEEHKLRTDTEAKLSEEIAYTESLERELDDLQAQLHEEHERIDALLRAKTEVERSLSILHMRETLLQNELNTLKAAKAAQETLYQDMIAEKEQEIQRLGEGTKRAKKRRSVPLEQQITIDDLLPAD